jgi:hypothetical protein
MLKEMRSAEQVPVSKDYTVRKAKVLEDALFSIGGFILTQDAPSEFLERPAVRAMLKDISSKGQTLRGVILLLTLMFICITLRRISSSTLSVSL